MAYEDKCAGCTYLSEKTYGGGKYWCSGRGEDHFATDSKCNYFCEAYSRSNSERSNMYNNSKEYQYSGCYLTTIICKILNFEDDNYYLNTLRHFRDDVMKNNVNYIPLLITYDLVGPIISRRLEDDKHREFIAKSLFEDYIKKAVKAVEEKNNDLATNIYVEMTNVLATRYKVNTNIVMPNIEDIDMENLGHARKLKPIEE